MKNIRYRLIWPQLILLWLLCSCSTIHEYPGGHSVDPTSIQVELVIRVGDEEYKPFVKAGEQMDARYVVEIYEVDSKGLLSGLPVAKDTLKPQSMGDAVTYTRMLKAKHYKVLCWADYVEPGTKDDFYYDTNTLLAVRLQGSYSGSNLWREAFFQRTGLDLTPFRDQFFGEFRESIVMEHAFAKYVIQTTDVKSFTEKEGLNVGDLNVKMSYNGYFPSSFNVLENRPNDAEVNVSYDSKPFSITDSTANLAFDYIWVNGETSFVRVNILVTDQEGKQVALNEQVQIDYKQGYLTIIRGEFLTKNFSSGIGIDREFDGDINIYL